MAFTRDVIVRLPGPNGGGDTWGVQWTEPGRISPGPIQVQAKAVRRFPNEDLLVELDGKTRRFSPDDDLLTDYTYKFVGRVNNVTLAAIRTNLLTLESDPNQMVSSTAAVLRKIIRDDVDLATVIQLMNVATGAENASVRTNALLLLSIIITNEL